jgi:hypothetical protein
MPSILTLILECMMNLILTSCLATQYDFTSIDCLILRSSSIYVVFALTLWNLATIVVDVLLTHDVNSTLAEVVNSVILTRSNRRKVVIRTNSNSLHVVVVLSKLAAENAHGRLLRLTTS